METERESESWFLEVVPEDFIVSEPGQRAPRYRPHTRNRNRQRSRDRPLTEEGLHPCDLKIVPSFTYSSDTHTLDDCPICLLEFADGDKARVLPNCNHTFHSHCIDEWIRSHPNCPLCRTPVQQRDAPVQPEPGEFVEPEDERLRDSV